MPNHIEFVYSVVALASRLPSAAVPEPELSETKLVKSMTTFVKQLMILAPNVRWPLAPFISRSCLKSRAALAWSLRTFS